MDISNITSLVALIGAIASFVIALRKAPFETKTLDAGASSKYAETAGMAADLATEWMQKYQEVNNKLSDYAAQILSVRKETSDMRSAYDAKINALEEENRALREKQLAFECEVGALKEKLNRRNRLIADWQIGIGRLIAQVEGYNARPVWSPGSSVSDYLREES